MRYLLKILSAQFSHVKIRVEKPVSRTSYKNSVSMKMKINTQPSNVYTLSHSKIQNCGLLSVLWLLPLLGGCSCWPPLSIGLQRGHISPPGCNMWSHLVRQQHKSLLLDRPEQFLSYNTLYMCWIFNQPCCTKTILNTASGMKILW